MELEKDMVLKLIHFLKEHDYPEASLATEYRIPGSHFKADLAVIDPKTNVPIIIFELKSKKSDPMIAQGKAQLTKYLDLLPDKSIPAYLVFPKDTEPFFEFINYYKADDKEKCINCINNIDYVAMRNAALSHKASLAEKRKMKEIDRIWLVSWILACNTLILLVCKKIFKIELDNNDMVLIGGIIALILIPFASKTKFFGIEFERYIKAKSDK